MKTHTEYEQRSGGVPSAMGHVARPHLLLRRAFWLLMVASHAPGLIAVWRSLVESQATFERLTGCIGLTLAMVFFVLKVHNPAFLQFRTDRRSVVAVCIIIALLHVDVIRRGSDPIAATESVALVATTWLAGALPRIRRRLSAAVSGITVAVKHRLPTAPWRDQVWGDDVRPHCWLLVYRFYCLRAPPA